MEREELPEFIAQEPHIFDNRLDMPWPDEDSFKQLARDKSDEELNFDDPQDWYARNCLANEKDTYFRNRYRGGMWAWNDFFPDEPLTDEPEQRLKQFLTHGWWAPAVDTALDLWRETTEDIHRKTAIFAAGLHIYDTLTHSWPFIDPGLANDSGVREKHMFIFVERINEVAELPMTQTEQDYFDPLKKQFMFAMAEIAAQSPISFSTSLGIMDQYILESSERYEYDKTRSKLVNLGFLSDEEKKLIIDRFRVSALDINFEYGEDLETKAIFCMGLLHLFNIVDMPKFYGDGKQIKWWRLPADQILSSDIGMVNKPVTEEEVYEQKSLF